MANVPINLAFVTPLGELYTILDHCHPEEPLSDYLLGQHCTIHMQTINSFMNICHYLFCLVLVQTAQLHPVWSFLVQDTLMLSEFYC